MDIIIAPLIGVFGTLLGILITTCIENKRRRKELIDKNKPIIINYSDYFDKNRNSDATILFESDGEDIGDIAGIFKNTDNGILYLDRIETETKKYYPKNCSTVDKNTVFYIQLRRLAGETLKEIKIFCHDIFGNTYLYSAHYNLEPHTDSYIVIDDMIPIKIKEKPKKK